MSFKSCDKWSVYGPEDLSEDAVTLKELKEKIKQHIKSFCISKAETSIKIQEYEITNVSITIRRI